jgi:hypothetical protein
MANTTIKITQLPSIGNGLSASTILPVVNTSGTAVTEKVSVGAVANFALTEAGNTLEPAFLSTIAYSVANAAQPNITSVGNLTGLTLTNLANFHIPGGVNGQYLQTDGNGVLNWVAGGGSGNGTVGGSNSQLQFNLSGSFAGDSDLTWDAGNNKLVTANLSVSGNATAGNINAVNVNVTANLRPNAIYTDHYYYANGYVFGGGGGNGTPGGSNTLVQFNDGGAFGGNTGFTFNKTTGIFTSPFLAGNGNGLSNIQGANISGFVPNANVANTALAVAGANVSGAVTLASTANSVAVANVVGIGNIATLALDGSNANVLYGNGVFAPVSGSGNTGNVTFNGNVISTSGTNDLLINLNNQDFIANTSNGGAIGLYSGNSQIAINNDTPGIEITSLNVNLVALANGDINLDATAANGVVDIESAGNTTITADGNVWTFTPAGELNFPGGTFAADDIEGTNNFGFETPANVGFGILTDLGNSEWKFGSDGNFTLPGNTFSVNYANGTQVNIGGGSGNTGNVTFDDVTVQGDNTQLNLSAGADFTANLAYLQVRAGDVASHIHLDTGNNEAYDLIVGDDAKFVQVSSTGDIIMSSYDGNTSYIWTFDQEGNLILAGGESAIQSVANSSLDPLNPNVSTMILTPSRGYSSQSLVLDPTAPGHIHLRAPSANIDEPLANIFLGGEESSFEIGYHNGNAPNAFIHSGGNTWTFDNAGTLTLPQGSQISETANTSVNITANANTWAFGVDGKLTLPDIATIIAPWTDDLTLTAQVEYNICTIQNAGSGYSGGTPLPTTTTGGTGSGMTVNFGYGISGQLVSVSVSNPGTGYSNGDVIGVDGGSGTFVITKYNISANQANNNTLPTDWTFGTDGNLTLPTVGSLIGNLIVPGSIVGSGASPAPYISGFSSANFVGNVTANYFLGNGSQLTSLPAPTVTQDITSNGAMSIMLYDGNIKYNNYATVEPSSGNITGGNLITSGQITSTKAGNLSDGGGQLYLNGSGNNRIDFNTNGTGAPTFTTRSAGAKVVLYPVINGTSTDYALGVDSGTFWSGIPAADAGIFFKWYAGTTEVANLSGTGILNVAGNIIMADGATLKGTGASPAPNISGFNSINSVDFNATGNISGNTNGYTIGYLNIPQVSASNTTLALTDAGKHYYSTTAGNFTLTIPNNSTTSFATGTAVSIVVQAAGNILVNAASGVTLYVAGNSTAANRVVGAYGMATLMKVASDTWFINGTGVS